MNEHLGECQCTCRDNTFFRIFSFTHIEHDAFDGGIMYGGVEITRDIPELGLKKGTTYDQVNFDFFHPETHAPMLHFINWELCVPENVCVNPQKDASVMVQLSSIHKHCKW